MFKIIFLVLLSVFCFVFANSNLEPDFQVDVLLNTILTQYDSARTSKDSNQTVLLSAKIKGDQPILRQVKQSIVNAISTASLTALGPQLLLVRQHIKAIKADVVINEMGTEVLVQEYRVREYSKVMESNIRDASFREIDVKIETIDLQLEQAKFTGAKLDPTVRAQILPFFGQLSQEVCKLKKQLFQVYHNELERIHSAGKELDLKQKYDIEVHIDFFQYVAIFVDIFQQKL